MTRRAGRPPGDALSPLDIDGLLDADEPDAPRPPHRPLLEDLSDDPGCAHEKADPERQARTVRTFYEAVTGERPPDPPAPPPEPRPSALSRLFGLLHPVIPFAERGDLCTVCRIHPSPIRTAEYGAPRFPSTFPCTLCGKTICQRCKVNRKTATWNIFCCEDCLRDPRPVVVKSNPFRCWFEGSPPKARGGITLCKRATDGLRGLFGIE